MEQLARCAWVGDDPLMVAYHDDEWGVPVHDDRKLFEFFVLDAFQAGLSWRIVLRKREQFRRAFDDFDPLRIARYGPKRVERLLGDAGIIRNRAKITGTINNARRFLEVRAAFGTFDAYVWRFVDRQPIRNAWTSSDLVPATSAHSDALSADLRGRGFSFVGSTICYAFMQAAGLINDHLTSCHRYARE